MDLETKKNINEQGGEKSNEQVEAQQLDKLSRQLQLNEQTDLGEGEKESEKAKITKKAMKAITAGAVALAITILSSMGPNEAYAGGAKVGEAGKFGTLDQRIKFNKMEQSVKIEKNRTNPNISINGKPGRVVFENDRTTVYGDENTNYQEDSRGNSSMIGGVRIDK